MSFEVERKALRDAAATWREAEASMTTAKGNAASIRVMTNEASIIADMVGFTSTYATVQQQVVDLLGEAATSMQLIDDTLLDIEKQYKDDDDTALATIGGAWAPEGS